MAEQRRTRRRSGNGSTNDSDENQGESRNRNRNQMSAADAVRRVREEFPALLGRPVESVLGVHRDDDDGWQVIVQVVELARIPNSTDVMGAYIVTLNGDGELDGYQRQRRFNRGQPDED